MLAFNLTSCLVFDRERLQSGLENPITEGNRTYQYPLIGPVFLRFSGIWLAEGHLLYDNQNGLLLFKVPGPDMKWMFIHLRNRSICQSRIICLLICNEKNDYINIMFYVYVYQWHFIYRRVIHRHYCIKNTVHLQNLSTYLRMKWNVFCPRSKYKVLSHNSSIIRASFISLKRKDFLPRNIARITLRKWRIIVILSVLD